MAYSAEPGKKVAYTDDLRWRVVWQRLAKEKPFRDIAESLNIGLGTVHKQVIFSHHDLWAHRNIAASDKIEGKKQISSIIIPASSSLGWRFCCHGYYTHQESKFKLYSHFQLTLNLHV